MSSNNKKRLVIMVLTLLVTVAGIGGSWAWYKKVLTGTRNQIVMSGLLSLELIEDENAISIENGYPIADEVGMLGEPFTFRIVNKTKLDTNYILRLEDITTGDKIPYYHVRYGLTKEDKKTIGRLFDLTDNIIDQGNIVGNDTIEYSLRLWLRESLEDVSVVKNKMLKFKLKVEIIQETEIAKETVTELAFNDDFLGSNCATYDDGTDTFLVGKCSQNYVWYSGKLWRVVLKNNETGAVKMVTDNAITGIPYNARNNPAFENSYMDQWLNQEFLPTLHDASDYLVTNYEWDASTDSSDTPTRPNKTTAVTRTVGLLNAYEYYTTYASSNNLATDLTSYLNAKVYWWLITPNSETTLRDVHYYGYLNYRSPAGGDGARPSVNLKSTIKIDSGSGSKFDPYILEGDIQETIGGTTLLSTRYSGEYIIFNDELYRIVGTETINGETLTKIIAVDKPSILSNNTFDATATNFANASIKSNLETYYQGLNATWKNMIQPNTTWYLGIVGSGTNYKASICATVDQGVSASDCARYQGTSKHTTYTTANIALPRVGEMFTSQIRSEIKADFWTLTPYSTSYVRSTGNDGYSYNSTPIDEYGARPSMYLKSDVVIASNNTGNGTYEYPYQIQ